MKGAVLLGVCVLVAGPVSAQPSIGAAPAAARTYDGRSGSLDVEPPRIDQSIDVDGNLDEAVWAQAAVLSGFSRYAPVDGAPADHATDMLVWYSPTAMHFGIRASAPAGTVRATLADRDRIQSDDHVIIFLSTYNDWPPGAGVRRQSARRAARWRASPKARAAPRRTSGRETPDLQPRLRLPVERPGHRARLRGRDAHPVQEPALSIAAAAGLGHSRHARRAAAGHRRQLGAGQAGRGVVPRAVGPAQEPDRSAPRPGARSESHRHREARWPQRSPPAGATTPRGRSSA